MGAVDGTYTSEDGKYTLTITKSYNSNGSFEGAFIGKHLTMGEINYEQLVGEYDFSSGNKYWPAQIGFYATFSPTPKSYVIADHWNGIRTANGNIIMSGVRTYTTDAGLYDIYTFEKVILTLIPTEQ
ncbi:hypothetical protein Xmau_03566 [Xenorhabdus mauleonii]|uniref:Uncharacterized protein n=1 Tax=Xenorhabdus mauleonii TaxID=351675 RepID=A0A1I3X0S8_9GAMM|nr:hypothetical protein [Xenorhabdus mauleonii]PHM38179.1 hypothetical protein Xmau_03566 [Xenorhabdus mauleonii]SFK13338.1 hypothetical protein SAMN05421680_13115 [Xenorhabdus mauleonii]